jgi:hypothetical protein
MLKYKYSLRLLMVYMLVLPPFFLRMRMDVRVTTRNTTRATERPTSREKSVSSIPWAAKMKGNDDYCGKRMKARIAVSAAGGLGQVS